jgi:hypothetical protein
VFGFSEHQLVALKSVEGGTRLAWRRRVCAGKLAASIRVESGWQFNLKAGAARRRFVEKRTLSIFLFPFSPAVLDWCSNEPHITTTTGHGHLRIGRGIKPSGTDAQH